MSHVIVLMSVSSVCVHELVFTSNVEQNKLYFFYLQFTYYILCISFFVLRRKYSLKWRAREDVFLSFFVAF